MEHTIKVTIEINGNELSRNYGMIDGQLPDNMQSQLQGMVDTLLDNKEVF